MGLLDGIEKLITEHGSAAILKERIALANDKYSAIEQKLADSELRAKQLESDNQALRGDLQEAKVEIQNLKKLSEKAHSNRLEEIREKILLLVANNDDITDQQLARSVGVGETVVTFHLEELKKSKMVSVSYTAGSDWTGQSGHANWSVVQAGRAYLINHGLIT